MFNTVKHLKPLIDIGLAEVGDYTYGTPSVTNFALKSKLRIGRFCSIAKGVHFILDGDHHTEWLTTYPFPAPEMKDFWPEGQAVGGHPRLTGDIVVKNDVWLGFGATIMGGVTIGNGAVVAACSMVHKDVPDYAIVGGNPAKVVKMRFDDKTIAELLELQWWNWDERKIRKNIPLLCRPDIGGLLAAAKEQ